MTVIRISNRHIQCDDGLFHISDNLNIRHLFTKMAVIGVEVEMNHKKEVLILDNKQDTIILARPATEYERDSFYDFADFKR
jgi:hypothetical protein